MPIFGVPNCPAKSMRFGVAAALGVSLISYFYGESFGLIGMIFVVIFSVIFMRYMVDVYEDRLFEDASLKLNKHELEELKRKPFNKDV